MISHVADEETEQQLRRVTSQFHATIVNLILASSHTLNLNAAS